MGKTSGKPSGRIIAGYGAWAFLVFFLTSVYAAEPAPTDQQINREIGYLLAKRDDLARQYEVLNKQIQELEAELAKRASLKSSDKK